MGLVFTALKEMSGAPAEFQILPEGKIEINGEPPAYIDAAAASDVVRRFKARGNDMVIDYEHQTLTDTQAPAAGWISDLIWRGKDGLWGATGWTKRAKEYLENREYRYHSPVILIGQDRKVKMLVNVALTNNPAMNNLKPIVAKLSMDWDTKSSQVQKREEEEIMIGKLRKLFGLADDAGEEKVLEAATLLVNKSTGLVACKEVLDVLGARAEAKKDEVVQLVASLKAPGDVAVVLSQEVAALKTKIAAMEQEDLVTLALKEGKTSPDELDKWGHDLALKNPESFKMIVLSRPAGSVIPVTEIVVAKDKPGTVPDDVQSAVNRQMGVTQDVFDKYNKKT